MYQNIPPILLAWLELFLTELPTVSKSDCSVFPTFALASLMPWPTPLSAPVRVSLAPAVDSLGVSYSGRIQENVSRILLA